MNNIEAYKNELRNYHFYKELYKKYSSIYEEEIKLDNEDSDKFRLLKGFYKGLVEQEKVLDGIFTQLTGFHAIRYDKEPSHISEELAMDIKLDLIDKYNLELKKYIVAIEYAEATLISEMNRISEAIKHIENVLDHLPKDVAKVCVDIYCNGKTYQEAIVNGEVYYTDAGLFKMIEREIEKVLYS